MITGKTLIDWSYQPGKWFGEALSILNDPVNSDWSERDQRDFLDQIEPEPHVLDPALQYHHDRKVSYSSFLDVTETPDEIENQERVYTHFQALMRTPTIVDGVVMPDACPAGSQPGTIPVGGVVATRDAIHPGFHSADVCCSMSISVFADDEPIGELLDIAQQTTHFGPGGRADNNAQHHRPLVELLEKFDKNRFLNGLEPFALSQFMTQGDGNHFFYAGHLESTGNLAIVTHHGSRGLGAALYKRGMEAAKIHTAIVSPDTPEHNAWLKADSELGEAYWSALQLVREWTRLNHRVIHEAMARRLNNRVVGEFWNEHNFVFEREGLFYHAKGATPSHAGFRKDDSRHSLIPLNMAQPILITRPSAQAPAESLGFAPHGAGRNLSRSEHIRRLEIEFGADSRGLSQRDQKVIFDRETAGLDVRFFAGRMDLSELPSAYKNVEQVQASIEKHNLAEIVDRVLPAGSIMAGEFKQPWRKKPK